jgi:hypothetical protein
MGTSRRPRENFGHLVETPFAYAELDTTSNLEMAARLRLTPF